MEWLFKITNSIKHGKLLSLIKPILSVVFVSSITYKSMNWICGPVKLPDRFQLNEIAAYFLDGNFIIPFGIFLLIWVITSYGFGTLFQFINLQLTEKFRKDLLSFTFIKSLGVSKNSAELNQVLELAKAPKKDWVMIIFERIKQKIDPKKANEIKRQLILAQDEYTSDFVLLLRSVIAIIIYKFTLQEFNTLLFAVLILVQILSAALLIVGYQLAVLLPIIATKIDNEYEIRKREEKLINPENLIH